MRERRFWTWHVAAGIVVLALLGLHMAIMHLETVAGIFNPAGGRPVDWANVVARTKSVAFTATYVLLLGAALFHGLYGLRNILFELNPGQGLRRALGALLLLGGFGLFALGTWAAVAGFGLARTL